MRRRRWPWLLSRATRTLLGVVLIATGARAGEPIPADQAAKAVLKDCGTFCRYSRLKFEAIQELLKKPQAAALQKEVAELQRQEARFLDRLLWYFDRGLKEKESAEKIREVQESYKAKQPQEILEMVKSSNYSEAHGIPSHLIPAEEAAALTVACYNHIPGSTPPAEASQTVSATHKEPAKPAAGAKGKPGAKGAAKPKK